MGLKFIYRKKEVKWETLKLLRLPSCNLINQNLSQML